MTSQAALPVSGGGVGGGSGGEISRPHSSKSVSSLAKRVPGGQHPLSNTVDSADTVGQETTTREGELEREDQSSLRQIRESSSAQIERLLSIGRSPSHREMGDNDGVIIGGGGGGGRDNASVSSLRSAARRDRDRDTESSADEETNIMRRTSASRLNYQATANISNPQLQTQGKRSGVAAKKKPSGQSLRRAAAASGGGQGHEEDEAGEHEGWWARFISKYGSVELENKGSVARDHLALERTFLAWLRTSLAFASIGIAITQLFRLNVSSSAPSSGNGTDRYAALRSMGKPLGATFLAISIVMLFIGFNRYFESQHWIIRGKFPASRGSIIIVALVTFALMVTSLVVVIVVEPGAREK